MIEAIQAGLTAAGIVLCIVLMAICTCMVWLPVMREQAAKWKRMKLDRKAAAIIAVVIAISYGGSKMSNIGADEGITLAAIWVEYDQTNEVTAVEVRYTGGTLTAATPVSVREADTDQWRELAKIDPVVITDLPTNVLSFVVAGNEATNRYWWVGYDTPAVIIETEGIKITFFLASSQSVQIAWTCDDPRATEFAVQRRRKRTQVWETVGVTSSMSYIYTGFTVGETWEWRVSSTYTEGN